MQKNVSLQKGFTLLEILITTAIAAVISMISASAYNGYVETTKISEAKNQIKALSLLIDDYALENGVYPESLADIGNSKLKDPWGNDYIYQNLRSGNGQGNGGDSEHGGSGGSGGESEGGTDSEHEYGNEYSERSDDDEHSYERDEHGERDSENSYDDDNREHGNSVEHDERINIGSARKDGNLVPINTYYDLCSVGKDGKTKLPLRAKDSHDDIIYANDGDYIGLASEF